MVGSIKSIISQRDEILLKKKSKRKTFVYAVCSIITLFLTGSKRLFLNEIPGAEYSIDGGLTWQDSPVFTGLEPNTGYRFIARIKATENSHASTYSEESAIITTAKVDISVDNNDAPPKPVTTSTICSG